MANFYIRHVLPFTTGLPRDRSEWAQVFTADAPPENPSIVPDFMEEFYNTAPGDEAAFSNYLSEVIDGANCFSEIYALDLASGLIGEPLDRFEWSATVLTGATPLPPEVALCSSYISNVAPAGVPARRRRGRVYMGPFSTTALATSSLFGVPSVACVASLAGATARLQTTMQDAGLSWGVWSRANAAIYPISAGWVDNAWDTQRRRGISETSRNSWQTL